MQRNEPQCTNSITDRHWAYWRKTRKLTIALTAIWFIATFVMAFFARELAQIQIGGWPLSFYMAAQGSLLIYLLIVFIYARMMRRLDTQHGVAEAEE